MTPELATFVRDLALDTKEFVAGYVAKALAAQREQFGEEIAALKQQIASLTPVPGPKGDPGTPGQDGAMGPAGPPGKDASPEQIKAVMDPMLAQERLVWQAQIREDVTKAYSALPIPRDGKDADVTALLALQASVAAMHGEWQAFKTWQAERPAPAVDVSALEQMLQKHMSSERPEPVVVDEDAIVERVKALIPVPRDGKDGQSIDPAIVDVMVAAQVEKAYRDAPKPKDGTSVTVADVQPLIVAEVQKAFEAVPVPKDGVNGKDGASVSVDDVLPTLRTEMQTELTKALSAIRQPKDGRDGQDGTSVTLDDVRPWLSGELQKAIEALPMPRDGTDGRDGVDGNDGRDGKDGRSVTVEDVAPLIQTEVQTALTKAIDTLPRAKDGTGIVSTLIDQDGYLILTLSDGRIEKSGMVVGKDVDPEHVERVIREEVAKFPKPQDGKDGKDGLGFDVTAIVFDEQQKTWLFRLESEDGRQKDIPMALPFDAGVFRIGELYKAGAGVTHKRAYWTALRDTRSTPGESRDWRMVLKGGRDGRDAPRGEP